MMKLSNGLLMSLFHFQKSGHYIRPKNSVFNNREKLPDKSDESDPLKAPTRVIRPGPQLV